MKVLLLYNTTKDISTPDDDDVLAQLEATRASLEVLGHKTESFGITLDLSKLISKLVDSKPDLIFNLVESIDGVESYMHFVPLILEQKRIKFSGCSSNALYVTTNKVAAKKTLKLNGLPTPEWFTKDIAENDLIHMSKPFIIKPISADASVGLDEDSVIRDSSKLFTELQARSKKYGDCFGEEYIEGREFNISVIEIDNEPVILPIAEIVFNNYPEGKEKVIGYTSKWDTDSFEYKNTVRSFKFSENDSELLAKLRKISTECWNAFNLSGYARVDFRVSDEGDIYILEVNANPCISPDAGFTAACNQAGIEYTKMIEVLLQAAK